MKRKIFLNIAIPPKVRRRFLSSVEKWTDLPVKWTKEANLHVTLLFLGYVETEDLPGICEKIRQATEDHDIFDLDFEGIGLAPDPDDPQYVWAIGQASEELKDLREDVEKALGSFTHELKSFRPHVTIGRIRANKWSELPEKPAIDLKFSLAIPVEAVEVMASDFGEGDSEYSVIEACPLK